MIPENEKIIDSSDALYACKNEKIILPNLEPNLLKIETNKICTKCKKLQPLMNFGKQSLL